MSIIKAFKKLQKNNLKIGSIVSLSPTPQQLEQITRYTTRPAEQVLSLQISAYSGKKFILSPRGDLSHTVLRPSFPGGLRMSRDEIEARLVSTVVHSHPAVKVLSKKSISIEGLERSMRTTGSTGSSFSYYADTATISYTLETTAALENEINNIENLASRPIEDHDGDDPNYTEDIEDDDERSLDF